MSNYNIDFAMSATLSRQVVEEMVKKVVEEQTGKKVSGVKFNNGDIGAGYTAFTGCVVTFVTDKPKTEYSSLYAPGTR